MGKQLTSSVSMIEEDLRSQTRAVSYLSDSSISFNQTSAETPLRPAFGDNHADMQAITFVEQASKLKTKIRRAESYEESKERLLAIRLLPEDDV
ncbi:hypothetical protein KCU72_g44, partial [Aureobasidium melanogenum]